MRNAGATARPKSGRPRKETSQAPAKRRRRRQADIHPLDRAIAELRNELARAPNEATLHARLGALYYRRGDLGNAETCYRRAVKRQPTRPSYHNNLGNVLCDQGGLKEGIACYETAMRLEQAASSGRAPSAEAVTNLELARLEYRLIHERIEYFERTVQLDVESAEALNGLGGGYLLRNQRERALGAFREALKNDPHNVYAARNIGLTHTLEMPGPSDLSGARAELAEAAMRFPNEARLFLHQGELLESGGLFEEAEERYRRALKADARCLEAYDLLGRLRELNGLEATWDVTAREVQAALERLLGAAKTSRVSEREAAAASYDRAFAEVARARFERRAPADPEELDRCLRKACRLADAQEPPAAAIAVPAAVLRAQLLESDGRRDAAALVLDQACERHPQAGRLWFERGGLAFRAGETALAVESFERATLVQTQEAYPYCSLRFAFEGYRRYRTERVRFEAAMGTQPRNATAHHHLALAALSVMKDEEALFHFSRALELDPRLSEAACGRGRALQRQGHAAEAEAAFRRALAIDPNDLEAQRALQQRTAQKNRPVPFPYSPKDT